MTVTVISPPAKQIRDDRRGRRSSVLEREQDAAGTVKRNHSSEFASGQALKLIDVVVNWSSRRNFSIWTHYANGRNPIRGETFNFFKGRMIRIRS